MLYRAAGNVLLALPSREAPMRVAAPTRSPRRSRPPRERAAAAVTSPGVPAVLPIRPAPRFEGGLNVRWKRISYWWAFPAEVLDRILESP